MARKKNRKHKKLSPTLAAMFKLSREQLASRKTTGGGAHRSGPKFQTRSEQKRRAISDQDD